MDSICAVPVFGNEPTIEPQRHQRCSHCDSEDQRAFRCSRSAESVGHTPMLKARSAIGTPNGKATFMLRGAEEKL
jgi:hypothetical protein